MLNNTKYKKVISNWQLATGNKYNNANQALKGRQYTSIGQRPMKRQYTSIGQRPMKHAGNALCNIITKTTK